MKNLSDKTNMQTKASEMSENAKKQYLEANACYQVPMLPQILRKYNSISQSAIDQYNESRANLYPTNH